MAFIFEVWGILEGLFGTDMESAEPSLVLRFPKQVDIVWEVEEFWVDETFFI
jgi:hypothetical protein